MITKRELSSISYNTEGFLQTTLDNMIKDRIIDFWSYIKHYPEVEETKSHIHLYFIPNNRVDTDHVKRLFEEVDPIEVARAKKENRNARPLGLIDIHCSKFDDWFLYALHDIPYLASKGQSKKYQYTKENIVCSNIDELQEKISRIRYGNYRRQLEIISALDIGRKPMELLRSGLIPINQYSYWEKFWERTEQQRWEENRPHILPEEECEEYVSPEGAEYPF